MSGKVRTTCCSRMTWRGTNSAIVKPTTEATALTSATSRRTSLLVRLGTKTEDDLIAIHDINIEMDGHPRAPRRLEPREQRLTGEVKLLRTKRSHPPPGYIRESS